MRNNPQSRSYCLIRNIYEWSSLNATQNRLLPVCLLARLLVLHFEWAAHTGPFRRWPDRPRWPAMADDDSESLQSFAKILGTRAKIRHLSLRLSKEELFGRSWKNINYSYDLITGHQISAKRGPDSISSSRQIPKLCNLSWVEAE